MEQILEVVNQLLAFLGEGEAAGIVEIIKGIDFAAIFDFFKSILALFGVAL